MSAKFQLLSALGAGDFEHLDGSLLEHLRGTKRLLAEWGASEALQDAGLYHAAYGTAGFSASMVCLNQRENIAQVIGKEAEEIVYQYSACDRKVFFAELAKKQNPLFPNRFNGQRYRLSKALLKNFCELTAANEVEIAIDNPEFIQEHGQGLKRIFSNMAANLSAAAIAQTKLLFG